eukprot:g40748.t1
MEMEAAENVFHVIAGRKLIQVVAEGQERESFTEDTSSVLREFEVRGSRENAAFDQLGRTDRKCPAITTFCLFTAPTQSYLYLFLPPYLVLRK